MVQVSNGITEKLFSQRLITPPPWLPGSVQYEAITGSFAYGVSGDDSDSDVYGFCIPRKDMVFPHLAGEIPGFGNQIKRFEQYQQHHIRDEQAGKQYDISIYNIVRYFQLCMENNPNMIDSMFVPEHCILHITPIGQMVREQRRLFLHKGSWFKFKGYAYSQIRKAETRKPEPGSNREKIIAEHGWDTKFGYHTVRLILEAEQILTEGDLDLTRWREHLKAIRSGLVPLADVKAWFQDKELSLDKLYNESKLRHSPDVPSIKRLLLDCLEQHYGTMEACVVEPDAHERAIRQILAIAEQTVANTRGSR